MTLQDAMDAERGLDHVPARRCSARQPDELLQRRAQRPSGNPAKSRVPDVVDGGQRVDGKPRALRPCLELGHVLAAPTPRCLRDHGRRTQRVDYEAQGWSDGEEEARRAPPHRQQLELGGVLLERGAASSLSRDVSVEVSSRRRRPPTSSTRAKSSRSPKTRSVLPRPALCRPVDQIVSELGERLVLVEVVARACRHVKVGHDRERGGALGAHQCR